MGQLTFPSGLTVGTEPGVFVIAEAGVNHNGDTGLALELVAVAAEAGADAVKFQTFKAANVASTKAPKAEYQEASTGTTESQLEMLRKLEFGRAAHEAVAPRCEELGIMFLSTPFDVGSAALLDELGVPLFKVSSGELTNHPFLTELAQFGRPLILSTGMATLGEAADAVSAVERAGMADVALLHCVSNYPAAVSDVNLRAMHTLSALGKPVGYSDHTLGIAVAIGAAALGAQVIEKHFTLDRTMEGPDHQASLEPHELRAMIRGIREVSAAMGNGRKVPAPSEQNTADVARRSVVAVRDLDAGTVLARTDLDIKRPGTGIAPAQIDVLVGMTLRADVGHEDVLLWDHFK